MYDTASSFFNASSIFTIFKVEVFADLFLGNMQEYLNDSTQLFIKDSYSFATTIDSSIHDYRTNFFPNLGDSIIFEITSSLVTEFSYLSHLKNDAEVMIQHLPHCRKQIGTFEVLSVNVDNSLYECLSTPDFKLYYPEPFIASPSFVHEEV